MVTKNEILFTYMISIAIMIGLCDDIIASGIISVDVST